MAFALTFGFWLFVGQKDGNYFGLAFVGQRVEKG